MARSRCPEHRLARGLLAVLLAATSAAALAADELVWREVDPDNLAVMDLRQGRVIIELNPTFAPETVKQFRKLVEDGFYDGLSFYRVIDGFVAQGGDGSDLGELSRVPLIDAEFDIEWNEELPYTQVQTPDLFAPETGFVDGFAVARDAQENRAWLAHCPGVVAMARNDSPDSSRTDFYIVIGQAPRYLDRNLNVFGRVVDGMPVVQQIRRGKSGDNGIIQDETESTRIYSLQMGSEIPKEERKSVYVADTNSEGFEDLLKNRRHRKQKFFHNRPPAVLDVCQVPVGVLVTK